MNDRVTKQLEDQEPRGPVPHVAPHGGEADTDHDREVPEVDVLSPLTIRGVTFRNRIVMPDDLPLFVRISATDWVEGGWDIEQSVELAKQLKAVGVDLIDVSSGGLVPRAHIPVAKGYQVPFARRIREEADIGTGAVGLITQVHHADEIITGGDADLVFLGRELLREPYWALKAQHELEEEPAWPIEYGYAVRRRARQVVGLGR
jgi:2,4-dienoyl-CoA reductase-like NADH-dependent reductase (Old Yellow Enzyme family)